MRYPNPSHTRLAVGTFLLSASVLTQAATFTVTTEQDEYDGTCDSHCSLRDAVTAANQAGEPTTIDLPAGTYTLTRSQARSESDNAEEEDGNLLGDLDVRGELLIEGAGVGKTVISGPDSHLFVITHRLFEVHPGANLAIRRLTLTDGRSGDKGGALENHGRLSLQSVHLLRNISRENMSHANGGYGGAIANYGELLVQNSDLEGNSAIKEVAIPLGGAIYNSGNLWVRDSRFFRNTAGGLPLDGAGAAIHNQGAARIERSSFVRSHIGEYATGGAINNDHGGVLNLTNSTLSGNSEAALSNGRHDAASKAILNNVTVVDNEVGYARYAVMNWGQLRIRNSLIAGNYEEWREGEFAVNCANLGEAYSYQAVGLLLNDEGGNCNADVFVPHEQTFTQVLDLSMDKGRTWYHALLPGSPAIDAGVGDCANHDQRRIARPQDGDGDGVAVCDLGAYELVP